MHTITRCPRCGKDFMYHHSDVHLNRNLTLVDEFGNNEIIDVVICQDCDEREKSDEKTDEEGIKYWKAFCTSRTRKSEGIHYIHAKTKEEAINKLKPRKVYRIYESK